jgi:hypothetical protein
LRSRDFKPPGLYQTSLAQKSFPASMAFASNSNSRSRGSHWQSILKVIVDDIMTPFLIVVHVDHAEIASSKSGAEIRKSKKTLRQI